LKYLLLRGEKLEFKHKPVMLEECIQGLNIKDDGIYVDGTLGGAGHSKEIAKRLSDKGLLIGIDRDDEALKAAKENLNQFQNVKFIKDNHDNIKQILTDIGIEKVDGILLDLGVSSYQLDERNRGFSYLGENELDMRMDKEQSLSAKEVVNTYTEEELANIIYEYGEERFSRQIARNICDYRKKQEIQTTKQLVEIIEKSIPKSKQTDGHPAKRTFQAIRIEVNNEIKPLYNTIKDCIDCLNSKGRLCVITFHSLEDRAVKKAMIDAKGKCTCPSDFPYCVCGAKTLGNIITKKPIIASKEEQEENSRSKSAKLRIFEKI
jgi:S-adenosyl-methyltransferase mraW